MTESEHKQSVHISRASILLLNFQQSDRAHMRNKRHIAIDFKLLHIIITRQKEDMQRQILPRCKIYPANLYLKNSNWKFLQIRQLTKSYGTNLELFTQQISQTTFRRCHQRDVEPVQSCNGELKAYTVRPTSINKVV